MKVLTTMDNGGRPQHDYYDKGKFKRVQNGAQCLFCQKVLKNTGAERLKAHR